MRGHSCSTFGSTLTRWRGSVAVALATALVASCASGPEPAELRSSRQPDTAAEAVELQHRELRVEGLERRLRRATLRIRNRTCPGIGAGSAFAVHENLLVTNRHVVEGAAAIEATTWDGRVFSTDVVAQAVAGDLALVGVSESLPAVLDLGRSAASGDKVTVVGYPGGGAVTLTEGHVIDFVSGEVFMEPGMTMRLDAPIAPGSSGGPVVDNNGDVVAIIFAIERDTGHALAVPIETLEAAVDSAAFTVRPPAC